MCWQSWMEQYRCSGMEHSIPYFLHTTLGVPITKIVDSKVLDMMRNDEDAKNNADKGDAEEADLADVEE